MSEATQSRRPGAQRVYKRGSAANPFGTVSVNSVVELTYYNTPNSAAGLIEWMKAAVSCCNSMRVDDTCCMFGSIISDHCSALNAPVAFTLTFRVQFLLTSAELRQNIHFATAP